MTHQVALPPEQEQKLTQQARLHGLAADDYLRQIVTTYLNGVPATTASATEVDEWLDALADSGESSPPLSADALTRESLYADHD